MLQAVYRPFGFGSCRAALLATGPFVLGAVRRPSPLHLETCTVLLTVLQELQVCRQVWSAIILTNTQYSEVSAGQCANALAGGGCLVESQMWLRVSKREKASAAAAFDDLALRGLRGRPFSEKSKGRALPLCFGCRLSALQHRAPSDCPACCTLRCVQSASKCM